MTTIRVRILYHNIARPERIVSKTFEIDRDLVADPIEPNDALHLDGNCAENLVVRNVTASVEPGIAVVVESLVAAYGMDENLKANIAAADGWTIER